MRAIRAAIAVFGLLTAPGLARGAFTSVELSPADGYLNPDPNHGDGRLTIRFAAEETGTARLSGTRLAAPIEVDYASSGATATITLPADAILSINEVVQLELRIVTPATDDEATEPVTTVRAAVDATRPPVPTDVRTYGANRALVVSWSGGIPDPPPFTSNVEKYIVYWSSVDLAEVLTVTIQGDRGAVPATLPTAVSSVTVNFTDNYLLEGLQNGVPVWVAVEAIDHVGWRSGLEIDDKGKVVAATGTPVETRHLGELAGIDDRCFVVTAAFGARQSPWVAVYRDFRDRFLLRLPGGETLVEAYYRRAPRWSAWLREHPMARQAARAVLIVTSPVAALAAATGPLGGLLLGAALVMARCRRRAATVLALIATLGAPEAIYAAQAWALRVAPFFPENAVVDPGVGVSYADAYGPYGTWRIEAEYVWSPLDTIGHLGFGGRAGFATDEGRALASSTGGVIKSGEKTRLLYAPFSLLARYRGQWMENQPVVPVIGGGLDLIAFQENRESSDEAMQNFAYGWHAEAQLELLLDWMERSAAAFMDENYAITDTLLYGGWQYSRTDDFGQPHSYDLSQQGWTVGLRFILR